MTIRVLCNVDAPGAFADLHWTDTVGRQSNMAGKSKADYAVYVREFAEGATVDMREMNGYDDSDFYATYWDAEQGKFVEVCYASTRGWTYPANAFIDATPEVAARYQAMLDEAHAAARRRADELEAKRPRKGRRCRITAKRGKAAALCGREGVIFWMAGTRVGVDVNGARVFLNTGGLEVLPEEG